MKESPNKNRPQEDVIAVVEELYNLFQEADDGRVEPIMELRSHVGSTFHARVLNAARHLDVALE